LDLHNNRPKARKEKGVSRRIGKALVGLIVICGLVIAELSKRLLHYKYFALFLFKLPSGPSYMVVTGSLAAAKILDFWTAYLVIVIGDLTGDTFYYCVGRWGGLRFLKRWGQYIWLDPKRVDHLKSRFASHGGKILLFGKFTQIFGAVILAAAGVAEMSYLRFLLYNLLATLPKTLFFLLIGFYCFQAYPRIHRYSGCAAAVFILLTILVIWIAKRKNREFA
jgi:membrane protein DedA with SNARE-associated domain